MSFYSPFARSSSDFVIADADASAKQGVKPRREKKEAFKLDFLTPADKDFKELTKELFAPVTKGAGINLPGTGPAARKSKKKGKEKEKKDDHSLPDDMHFSSRQLVSLFLKPKFQVRLALEIGVVIEVWNL